MAEWPRNKTFSHPNIAAPAGPFDCNLNPIALTAVALGVFAIAALGLYAILSF